VCTVKEVTLITIDSEKVHLVNQRRCFICLNIGHSALVLSQGLVIIVNRQGITIIVFALNSLMAVMLRY